MGNPSMSLSSMPNTCEIGSGSMVEVLDRLMGEEKMGEILPGFKVTETA